MTDPTITSRYGKIRTVTHVEGNWYRVSGLSRYYRAGCEPDSQEVCYFDFEGGPFISTRNELVCDQPTNCPYVTEIKLSNDGMREDGVASVDVLLTEPLTMTKPTRKAAKKKEPVEVPAATPMDIESVIAPIEGPVDRDHIYGNDLDTLLTQLSAVNVAVGMYRALKATGQMSADDERIYANCQASVDIIRQVILEKFTRRA